MHLAHSRRVLCFVLLSSLALFAFRCGEASTAPSPSPVAKAPKPDLRLMLITDPRGYLEPCGCQQRPLGGVDKLAATLAKARADGVPTLLLAAGDLTVGTTLHGDDEESAHTEELWRAETWIDVYNQLGAAAVTPWLVDFAIGLESQRALMQRSKFPWLLDNVSLAEGNLEGVGKARIVQAGERKVGVFGLIAPNAALPASLRVDANLRGVAQRLAKSLRDEGAELVVALVSGDRRAARDVAQPGVDFVVLGGLDQEEPIAPAMQQGSALLHAGRQGQRVLTLELSLKGTSRFQDVSEWTRRVARDDVVKRIDDLKARFAEWKKDPKTKPEDLAAQAARLKQLESELGIAPAPDYSGRWFSAAIVDLAPEVTGDAQIAAGMDAFDKRVNQHNKEALKDRLPKPVAAGAAAYAGSDSCKGCHEAAYRWWRGHKHGHAYKTLEDVNKEFSLACVSCHVTGYNQPGGSTVTHVENLKDVGCESCHGPGSLHNAQPEQKGLVSRDTPETVCKSCHNQEHSSRFQYEAFRSLLIVPGHGLPAKPAGR